MSARKIRAMAWEIRINPASSAYAFRGGWALLPACGSPRNPGVVGAVLETAETVGLECGLRMTARRDGRPWWENPAPDLYKSPWKDPARGGRRVTVTVRLRDADITLRDCAGPGGEAE